MPESRGSALPYVGGGDRPLSSLNGRRRVIVSAPKPTGLDWATIDASYKARAATEPPPVPKPSPKPKPVKRRPVRTTVRKPAPPKIEITPTSVSIRNPHFLDAVARLYQSGLSIKETAHQLGAGETTVHRALTEAGVPKRPAHHNYRDRP